MTIGHLLSRFNTALAWNALLYLIYKLLLTTLSFFLYYRLDTSTFYIWTSINSCIFLMLLWLDFGFRKSIPRFTLAFSSTPTHLTRFIALLIIFRIFILILFLPIFWFALDTILTSITHHPTSFSLLLSAVALFLTEGISSLMELIYHAHFMHKFFNSINSAILILSMMSCLWATFYGNDDQALLMKLIILRALGAGAVAFLSSIKLPTLIRKAPEALLHKYHIPVSITTFAKHSGCMWITSSLKSLSERNALVPFLALALGPASANAIKIANDAALLFYRTILKTIGTTDTTFLVHAYHLTESPNATILSALVQRVLMLCLTAFACACGCLWYTHYTTHLTIKPEYGHIFFIFVLGYLIEVALSPIERMFEVQGRHKILLHATIPYTSALLALGIACHVGYITTPCTIIMSIQGIRLSSSLLLVYFFVRERIAHQSDLAYSKKLLE